MKRRPSPEAIISTIGPLLTDQRKEKIELILAQRTDQLTIVLEKVYDMGNIYAIYRTCENFGIQDVHLISNQGTKPPNRITKGAEKWLSIHHHPSLTHCLQSLTQQGYGLYTSALQTQGIPMPQLPWQNKLALIFGNEREGVSPQAQQYAQGNFIIPTQGMSQSFNISVAVAITLGQARLGHQHWTPLPPERQQLLRADFYYKSYEHASKLHHFSVGPPSEVHKKD